MMDYTKISAFSKFLAMIFAIFVLILQNLKKQKPLIISELFNAKELFLPTQKEQDNPTSAQFIKNIQADNVALKDTDFEKAIEKVALVQK